MLDAFELVEGVEKQNSLKSSNFLIISYRTSIFFLCLIWADAMVVATMEIIVQEIECYIAESTTSGNIAEMSLWK